MLKRTERFGSLAVAVLLLAAARPALAQEGAPAVQLMAGIFNVGKSPTDIEAGFELRRPTRFWGLELAGGIAASDEESIWAHLGLRRDFEVGPRFVLAPGFAFAFYERGDGKDLGGEFQFRSSIDLGFRLSHKTRVGLTFYHLSNAGLEEVNPGSNSAVLSYSVRLKGG